MEISTATNAIMYAAFIIALAILVPYLMGYVTFTDYGNFITRQAIEEYHSEAGDPVYVENHDDITITSLFPEQYHSWDVKGNPNQDKLFYFDYDCNGANEMGDRNPVGTLTLFIDYYPTNGKLDCGWEALWSLEKSAYSMAERFDTNKDGYLDENDSYWGIILLTDWDVSWTPEELGYTSFDISEPIVFQDDCFGVGIYSDGYEGYVPDEAYRKCVDAGFEPLKLSDSHFRLKGMQECGAIMENGTCNRTYSGVLGYWEKVN